MIQTNLDFMEEDDMLEEALEKNKDKLSTIVKAISYEHAKAKEYTSTQRNIIDSIINDHPEGLTDIEICLLTGFSRSSVNARRNELEDVIPVGLAVYQDEHGNNHLNVLWGKRT